MNRKAFTYITFAALIATVFAANWLIVHYGIVPVPFTGLMAPAGVYAAGLAFGFRDILQDLGGRRWVLVAIIVGAACSAFVSPQFAVASAAAFLFSEAADFAVYTGLADSATRRGNHWFWLSAVILSNLVGAIIDSAIFLYIAFGNIDLMAGQVVGKIMMTAPVLPFAWYARHRIRNSGHSGLLTV